MKLPRTAHQRDPEAGLIPLINVVFLLLIFLMLSGSLSRQDAFPVTPPVAESGAMANTEPLVVLVAADGRLAVAGQQVSEAELLALARRGEEDQTVAVSLKADAQVDALDLVQLMEKLRAQGVSNITLMTARDG